MLKNYFVLFLLGHIVGDFYFQTESMAYKKKKSLAYVLQHSLLYWLAMILFTLPILSYEILLGATVASVLHCVIDIVKFNISKKDKNDDIQERNLFIIDQILHMIILFVIAFTLVLANVSPPGNYIFAELFNIIGISELKVIYWLCALLIIHKPANIIIAKFIKQYKPADDNSQEKDQEKDQRAGRIIGTLERIIMLLLITINQYSAIGLVLTAKSIARNEKIAKDKNFAEYYLLGTLLSALIAIVTSFIF
ncbi:MAG: DUF3307 domain-containing protein [Clostridiales bacterium]|jgi:hypothetical protein|nr:DUF3307 domain-containing protein [Clostridiales bacterium]